MFKPPSVFDGSKISLFIVAAAAVGFIFCLTQSHFPVIGTPPAGSDTWPTTTVVTPLAAPAATQTPELPYPPPRSTEAPTPTMDWRRVRLEDSPYREILLELQAELDDANSEALARRVPEESYPLSLHAAGVIEGGSAGLGRAETRRALDTFFDAGSHPRIHGYFLRKYEPLSDGVSLDW